LILILYEFNEKFKKMGKNGVKKMGSGLAFCLSHKNQEFHINALKSHCRDESVIDISYHQDEIATLPRPFIKKGVVAPDVTH